MFTDINPVGLIIYKNTLQYEYELEEAFELKTLYLLDPEKNSGRGYGSVLYQRIDVVAATMHAKLIYCTASANSAASMRCLFRNGYKLTKLLNEGSNQMGSALSEYLLTKDCIANA